MRVPLISPKGGLRSRGGGLISPGGGLVRLSSGEVIPQTLDGIANAADPLQAFADACGMDFKMDRLWIGGQLVGATELSGSGLDLVNTGVTQGSADARLGDGDTCLFDADADTLSVASDASLNIGTGSAAWIKVHAINSVANSRYFGGKHAASRGYLTYQNAAGYRFWFVRTASGIFTASLSIDHGLVNPQVDLMKRDATAALNSLVTREGTATVAETGGGSADNAGAFAVGSVDSLAAVRGNWGLDALVKGANAELVTATHRSNLQTWLSF